MPCLYKYWLKEFTKFFFIIQVMILVVFVIIDYLSRLEKFINSELSLLGAFGFVLLKVPFMFLQLTPASILLSSIIVFGVMNRSNELIAIRSSGISSYFLVKPAVFSGVALSMVMFFLGETIVPVTMAKANYIKYVIIKKKNNIFAAREDIWIKSENKLIHINFFDPVNKSVAGVTITSLTKKFGIEKRLDAQRGVYENKRWVFEGIIEQTHKDNTLDYDVKLYDKKHIPLAFKPDDLGDISKKSNEMSFFELRKYVKKVEQEGYDATTYKVDMNGKIAFPFICIIMVLTGAATGMRSFVKSNLPAGIAMGVIIAFSYWIMYGFCLSLGYGGILPPFLSAWAANVFFLCVGILYLINTE